MDEICTNTLMFFKALFTNKLVLHTCVIPSSQLLILNDKNLITVMNI